MTRRMLLVLLLLLPFTMAPRTSSGNPELFLTVVTNTSEVTAGVPVPIVVRVRNVSNGVAAATPLEIGLSNSSTIAAEDVTVLGVSPVCQPTQTFPVTCDLGHVWEATAVRLLVVSSESGTLVPVLTSKYAVNQ